MDVFTLASRYLRTRVIAWVSLLFIAFGVWANVVVNAVFDGFRERILNHIRAVQSDLTILIPDYRGYDHSAAVRRLLANEMTDRGGPIAALAPRLADHGLVAFVHSDGRYDYQRKAFANLIGVDWKAESAVVPLGAMIRSLKPEDERLRVREEDLDDPFANRAVPGVLIGTSMARKLKLRRGDELDLVTAELSPSTEERFVTSNRRFMLVGCFDSGNEEYDVQNVYVAREEFV
ncbi:MAG TPA: hypothetical protein VEI02_05980, partial [Planctomycetota bacterium]|nr:hypothetical protein [Planctomycetota bacterium]